MENVSFLSRQTDRTANKASVLVRISSYLPGRRKTRVPFKLLAFFSLGYFCRRIILSKCFDKAYVQNIIAATACTNLDANI